MTRTGSWPSCTGCDWNKKHAQVTRWWDERTWTWKYCRRCNWCGSVYPATLAEYEAQEAA